MAESDEDEREFAVSFTDIKNLVYICVSYFTFDDYITFYKKIFRYSSITSYFRMTSLGQRSYECQLVSEMLPKIQWIHKFLRQKNYGKGAKGHRLEI